VVPSFVEVKTGSLWNPLRMKLFSVEVKNFLLSVIVPCGSELFPVEKIKLRKIEQFPMEVKLFPAVVIEYFTQKT
jgi:hypothetical protein